jgi:hypothetical protein
MVLVVDVLLCAVGIDSDGLVVESTFGACQCLRYELTTILCD